MKTPVAIVALLYASVFVTVATSLSFWEIVENTGKVYNGFYAKALENRHFATKEERQAARLELEASVPLEVQAKANQAFSSTWTTPEYSQRLADPEAFPFHDEVPKTGTVTPAFIRKLASFDPSKLAFWQCLQRAVYLSGHAAVLKRSKDPEKQKRSSVLSAMALEYLNDLYGTNEWFKYVRAVRGKYSKEMLTGMGRWGYAGLMLSLQRLEDIRI